MKMSEDEQFSVWDLEGLASCGLQTAYLIISLVVAVGCSLVLIYLVYRKEYLQRACNYLRCSLAAYDIIFMCCMVPTEIYILFQTHDSNSQTACWVKKQLFRWLGIAMSGTYLLMAIELYYYICHPLHYHQKVTTKRVVISTLVVMVFSLLLRVVYIILESLQNPDTTSQCSLEYADITGPAAVIQNIMTGAAILAFLLIFISYFLVFKEAKKQQERDENHNLWLYQTRAFKKLAPHAITLAVWVGTIIMLVTVSHQNEKQGASFPLRIATRVAVLLYATLSSMVNPIVYSFRMPNFRRALRETFGWPGNTPAALAPPPDDQQRQDVEMAVFSVPDQGQGGSIVQS
ncbi:OR51B5 [Branchiostoma lanceolatum]|uniref:OR51B5 protein n=1 Tax=Branchiostoma lanceolatum TaxID=7740 RepID=A0A8K0A4N3_BRALA|nr:OR51B5 [Branchiostoma lanceolatum]